MESAYLAYLKMMDDLGKTLDQLTETAKKKRIAARNDDLMALDACIKQEQALSLSLRSFDRKRDDLLKQLGLTGVTLSKLADHYPESLRLKAKNAAETLRNKYNIYRSASEAARTTLECTLHEIEKMLSEEARAEQEAFPDRSRTDIRA